MNSTAHARLDDDFAAPPHPAEIGLLLVEDDPAYAALLRRALARSGFRVEHAATLHEARTRLLAHPPVIALVDVGLPDGSGLDLLGEHARAGPPCAMVIMTNQGCEQIAVDAMRRGALDYVVKGDAYPPELGHVLNRALREWGHIQDRRQAEELARRLSRQYRALYDDTPAMFFTVDTEGKVLSVNKFGARRLGYTVEELVGRSVDRLYVPAERRAARDRIAVSGGADSEVRHWEARKQCSDGSTFWAQETVRVVEDEDGREVTLMVCEDISDAHELSEQLAHQASHDPLTGLTNRREFERRLNRVLDKPGAPGDEHVVCFLDLDQFKVINDTSGHSAGDELLRQVADLLRASVRNRDTLARLGGDEFGVLMEHCGLRQGLRVANALRACVEGFRFAWDNRAFKLGASIGVVPVAGPGVSPGEVMSAADAACYTAKEQGRNRVHVYRLGDAELTRRRGEVQWVSRIQRAVDEGRLRLSAQPIAPADAHGATLRRCEVLLRMIDENGQVVAPGAFLPAAERYNLAGVLDRWVIDNTFAWLGRAARSRPELCSINVSGCSIGDPGFQKYVTERIEARGIDPRWLCFELTETAAIADLVSARRFMERFSRLGCRFALDDFGSGLSSFAYLRALPVDYIKIDGLFVRDVAHDPVDFTMVKAINEMGHVLGKQTIAEFVESAQILSVVRELGIDYAQGTAIGAPRAIELPAQ